MDLIWDMSLLANQSIPTFCAPFFSFLAPSFCFTAMTMSASDLKSASDRASKKARKLALKAEASSMGITYDELKERKKRKKREAEQLQNDEHQTDMKRMRTWSKDFDDDPTIQKQRIATRSMDETYVKPIEEMDISPQEWRSMHDITVRGHGANASATSFPAPYLKFSDAPFCEAIQKSFQQAGFDKPTHIQSQVYGRKCSVSLACPLSPL